jgi:hypothetical protein
VPGPRATRALFWFLVVDTVWDGLAALSNALIPVLPGNPRALLETERVVWMLAEVALVGFVGQFWWARKGSRGSGLAAAATGCAAGLLAIQLVISVAGNRLFTAMSWLPWTWAAGGLLRMSLGLLLWGALSPLAVVSEGRSIGYVAARVLAAAWILTSALYFIGTERFIPHGNVGYGIAQVVSLVADVLLLLRLRRAGWHAAEPGAASPAAEPAPNGERDLWVGGAWLFGGLAITVASFAIAGGGGRYLISTGPIAYGLVRLVRGLSRINASPKS